MNSVCVPLSDPLVCPLCGSQMRIIAFISTYPEADKIIDQLKLRFVAESPPLLRIAHHEFLMAAETSTEYLL